MIGPLEGASSADRGPSNKQKSVKNNNKLRDEEPTLPHETLLFRVFCLSFPRKFMSLLPNIRVLSTGRSDSSSVSVQFFILYFWNMTAFGYCVLTGNGTKAVVSRRFSGVHDEGV